MFYMENTQINTVFYNEKYFCQIVELWKEQYSQEYIEKRKQLFRWITEENPFNGGNPPYFILLDGQRVVGMHGHMPLLFTIYGKKQRGCLAHDDLLSQDYRGKGLGKKILIGTAEKTTFFSGALWFNEPNYKLYIKSGWLDIPNLQSFLKIYDPNVFLKSRIESIITRKILSSIFKKLLQFKKFFTLTSNYKNINIVEIEEFDANFDKFFDIIAPRFGIMVVRNQQYLNWKFVKKPYNNYKKYVAFDSFGELSGYMVVKSEFSDIGKRGRILDFLVHPDKPEIFNALLKHCCDDFERNNMEYVQIISSSPLIAKLLMKNEFIKAQKPVRFMVNSWENYFESGFIGNIENWYITDSDGDGDAWTVD